MLIRAATADDQDAIWALLKPVFRAGDTYAVDPGIARDAALAMWCQIPRVTYVVEIENRIVATYYIKTNQQGGGSHICNCGYVTSAAARGRGVAGAMCVHSQEQAREMLYKAMQFNFVVCTNRGAIRLWERAGFAIIGRIPAAFQHPTDGCVDALVMHKSLIG